MRIKASESFAYLIRTEDGWRQVAIVRGSDTRKIMEHHYKNNQSAGIDYRLVVLTNA